MRKILLVSLIVFAVIPAVSYAEEAAAPKAAQVEAAQPPPEAVAKGAQEMSIYGEVQAINAEAGSMTVQYYDYDTDEEKTTEIVLNKATKLENAPALSDLKKGDWVDVVYVVSDGKNTASSVIVEKEDEITSEPAPEENQTETPSEE